MKKGTIFTSGYNDRKYEVAGIWSDSLVLAPLNPEDEDVLIYEKGELQGLVDEGHFKLQKALNAQEHENPTVKELRELSQKQEPGLQVLLPESIKAGYHDTAELLHYIADMLE